MTPKDKAEKLVEKFRPLVTTWDCYWDTPCNPDDVTADAKKCALICVEEIIQNNPTNPLKGGYIELYSDMIDEAIEYWQQVKTQIESL